MSYPGVGVMTAIQAGAQLDWTNPRAKGLKTFWPFNEGGGLWAADACAGGRGRFSLTYNPGMDVARWEAGPFGRKPVFSGSLDQYFSTGIVSTRTNNVTFGLWYSPNVASQVARVLFCGASGTNGWGIYHNNGSGSAGTTITVILDGVAYNAVAAAYTIAAGEKVFLVATCRGTNQWRLYVNGRLFSTGTATAQAPTVGTGIGASSAGFEATNGWIDLPFVAERALGDGEIWDMYRLSGQAYGLLGLPGVESMVGIVTEAPPGGTILPTTMQHGLYTSN